MTANAILRLVGQVLGEFADGRWHSRKYRHGCWKGDGAACCLVCQVRLLRYPVRFARERPGEVGARSSDRQDDEAETLPTAAGDDERDAPGAWACLGCGRSLREAGRVPAREVYNEDVWFAPGERQYPYGEPEKLVCKRCGAIGAEHVEETGRELSVARSGEHGGPR